MRFLTATWSVVASLVVVLTMFSFAPVALGDPWAEGYLAGKTAGIDEGKSAGISEGKSQGQKVCKQNLLSCTSPTASSSDTCKECLPDPTDGKPYFVTNALTRDETTITDSVKTACRNDPLSCGISTKGGTIIKTNPSEPTSAAWIKAEFTNDKNRVLEWKEIVTEKSEGDGYMTWGYFYESTDKNPDVFAKVYRFNSDETVNIEFFHVSGGDINVMSCMNKVDSCNVQKTHTVITETSRYVRHFYQPKNNSSSTEDFRTINNDTEKLVDLTAPSMGNTPEAFEKVKISGDGAQKLSWNKGNDSSDAGGGNKVAWGYLGSKVGDPEVFVKFWFNASDKRIHVNLFFTSVTPKITVSSEHTTTSGKLEKASAEISSTNRYSRHEYHE